MEKLDNVQLQLLALSEALKNVLEPSLYNMAQKSIQDINDKYKPKKEIVRLSKVYFCYNLEPALLDKYALLCKGAIKKDK